MLITKKLQFLFFIPICIKLQDILGIVIKKEKMKIKNIIKLFLTMFFQCASIWTSEVPSQMPMVTRSYKGELFFKMGLAIPSWLYTWGLLGIIATFIIATMIESGVMSKLLNSSFKKIALQLFIANSITAIIEWIISACMKKINFFNEKSFFSLNTNVTNNYSQIIAIFLMGLLYVLVFFYIKMAMQYFIMLRYDPNINRKSLKKSILYANLISFTIFCLSEVISYNIPTKTITYS